MTRSQLEVPGKLGGPSPCCLPQFLVGTVGALPRAGAGEAVGGRTSGCTGRRPHLL